eukprot:CAMPEP_0178536770 /NCGR_PEP_ID=MMETSP0696-20121128/36256_1 /TAXON_ID=265572 /ORGANISM="Extubocellulus spinifer, Strain CCMP396" /LENGTH=268 /DNA_ID=CAMNT_0020168999 /DNA_START=139 /DNA_END=945 /DNA_ORIENTATION=+
MPQDHPTAISREEEELLKSLGVDSSFLRSSTATSSSTSDDADGTCETGATGMHPALKAGLGIGLVANLALLLSLPPVIMSKGAPYLPTFSRQSSVMFERIRQSRSIASRIRKGVPLTFVDLGSGDGRLVFQAARQSMFVRSIGYEINPVLHAFSCARRLIQAPKYWTTTDFGLRDLWKVELKEVDVVAIYGLQPIMKDLGCKLQKELRPGSIVVSNVFSIPGWRPSGASTGGVFIYSVPECWEKSVCGRTSRSSSTSRFTSISTRPTL